MQLRSIHFVHHRSVQVYFIFSFRTKINKKKKRNKKTTRILRVIKLRGIILLYVWSIVDASKCCCSIDEQHYEYCALSKFLFEFCTGYLDIIEKKTLMNTTVSPSSSLYIFVPLFTRVFTHETKFEIIHSRKVLTFGIPCTTVCFYFQTPI